MLLLLMYIRFVVGTNREAPRTQTGVVAELKILQDSGVLPSYEMEHIDEIFAQLNEMLPCPPFEQSKWPPDAISWFKGAAQEMISKFREIIAILEQYDRPVRTITTSEPGKILYEDAYQIVARSKHY